MTTNTLLRGINKTESTFILDYENLEDLKSTIRKEKDIIIPFIDNKTYTGNFKIESYHKEAASICYLEFKKGIVKEDLDEFCSKFINIVKKLEEIKAFHTYLVFLPDPDIVHDISPQSIVGTISEALQEGSPLRQFVSTLIKNNVLVIHVKSKSALNPYLDFFISKVASSKVNVDSTIDGLEGAYDIIMRDIEKTKA